MVLIQTAGTDLQEITVLCPTSSLNLLHMLIKDLIKINFCLFYLQLENLKRGVIGTTYLKLKSGMLWLFIYPANTGTWNRTF